MRIITLEEHFAIPAVVARIDPALIARRGFPMGEATPQFMHVQEALAELGAQRLADMDASGITLQVLSVSGPGADLLDLAALEQEMGFSPDYRRGWWRKLLRRCGAG